MSKNSFRLLKSAVCVFVAFLMLFVISQSFSSEAVTTLSRYGSSGTEVKAIQQALKDRGLFTAGITGYYGEQTQSAVRRFQKQQGLTVDGIAGPATLRALGVSIGSIPSSTEANINLLARIISAEARGERRSGYSQSHRTPIFPRHAFRRNLSERSVHGNR